MIGALAVLALIDSTSFGTLLIPIWLMLAPGRLRVRRVLLFLVTVATFYLLLGMVLTAGVMSLSEEIGALLDTRPVQIVQIGLGALLVVVAVWTGMVRRGRKAGTEVERLLAWRERAIGDQSSPRGLMALAVVAALIEAASMVPYLAAIGLIGTADRGWPQTVLLLVAYCGVMILPAMILLAARALASHRVTPVLATVNEWLMRTGQENTAWILGIIGVILAGNAAEGLGLFATDGPDPKY